MLKGISFEECNVEKIFHNLHTFIDILQYDWYIDDVDLNYFYFRSGKYSGKEFKDVLDEVSKLSFARIRRYPINAPIDCVDEYDDFTKSACDIMILFYDGGFYEIYSKEEMIISKTMDFCLNIGCENAEYIQNSEISRSYMHF